MFNNTTIETERTWIVNNPDYEKPFYINKTFLRSDYTGKKIPNTVVYCVDYDDDNLSCFKTLAEARKYAKEY